MSARRPKTEKGPEPCVEEPRVKVVGMLPFDEAAVEFGLSKKALREKVVAGVVASARVGDVTYVLQQENIGGRIASTLMELAIQNEKLCAATERIASTLEALGAAAPPVAVAAPHPAARPPGTYGEQVDAQVDRAIAQIENAEGDWGLFSQFLQPEWKPLPDVIYHHLQVANAVEIEEYDVTLAIPSRAISVLRAVKAKFGSRAQEQREAEYAGGYQENAAAFRYDSLPVTQLTPSAPFTEEQQREMERRHLFGVLTPSGLHLPSA